MLYVDKPIADAAPGLVDLRQMVMGYAQGFDIALPKPIEVGGFPPG